MDGTHCLGANEAEGTVRRVLALLHRLHPWHMLLPLSSLSSFYFSTSYMALIFFFTLHLFVTMLALRLPGGLS